MHNNTRFTAHRFLTACQCKGFRTPTYAKQNQVTVQKVKVTCLPKLISRGKQINLRETNPFIGSFYKQNKLKNRLVNLLVCCVLSSLFDKYKQAHQLFQATEVHKERHQKKIGNAVLKKLLTPDMFLFVRKASAETYVYPKLTLSCWRVVK